MGLLTRRTAAPITVDVAAAQAFDRMGPLTRALLYVLAQQRYARMKREHATWKALGLDRVPSRPAPFNPARGSHWMGRR